jgi:hypothetical protein
MARIAKIISGGQTGADRAGLDAAIDLGIPHGGWCPRGRLAEDGPVSGRYALQETESYQYIVRTERNVCDADATLVFFRHFPSGGTAATIAFARRHHKPVLTLDIAEFANPESAAGSVRDWLNHLQLQPELGADSGGTGIILNIAGPRESTLPGVYRAVYDILVSTFGCQ